jgi:hypothetical protein
MILFLLIVEKIRNFGRQGKETPISGHQRIYLSELITRRLEKDCTKKDLEKCSLPG